MVKGMTMRLLMVVLAIFPLMGAVGCSSGESTVEGERSVMLDLREELPPQTEVDLVAAVEYHGRYYCLFDYDASFILKRESLFYAIDANTLEVTRLAVPTSGYHYSDHLFVLHDTLFLDLRGSWEDHDYYFDTANNQWVECPEVEDVVYEDDDYSVYGINNGEFGQVTWFRDRHTGHEYALMDLGAVRRVGDTFYIVSPNLIRSVTVGQLAKARPSPTDHWQAEKDYYIACYYGNTTWLEADTVYSDPRYDWFETYEGRFHDTLICGSLVSGDSLLLLVDKPDGTALMRIAGPHELQTVKSLGERYWWISGARCANGQGNNLVEYFRQDAFSAGVIDIVDTQVRVLNIRHNIDTVRVQPDDGLEVLLDYLRDHWDGLTDKKIREFECSHGTTYITPRSIEHNGYFRDVGFDKGHRMDLFYRRIDTLYSLETEYCVRESDGRVRAVFFDFIDPMPYNAERKWLTCEEREEYDRMIGDQVIARLEALCGPRRRQGDYYFWHYGPLTLRFYRGSNRMLIF